MGRRLHDWLLATWYGGTGRGRWLLPLAWLFGGLARLRRTLYARGILGRYRSRRPVVIVGNLTIGGSGKTPFVVWLASELSRRRLRVGVAMRGYGGAGGAARRLTDADTAATAGDEPLMIRRRLSVPVAVAARRADAVRLLEPDCDVILCDDGLQHYALARDLEIVVVDGMRGFGNGRRLPAGPLREPVSRLDEADAVVVNGGGFERPGAIHDAGESRGEHAQGDTHSREQEHGTERELDQLGDVFCLQVDAEHGGKSAITELNPAGGARWSPSATASIANVHRRGRVDPAISADWQTACSRRVPC